MSTMTETGPLHEIGSEACDSNMTGDPGGARRRSGASTDTTDARLPPGGHSLVLILWRT